MNRNLTVIMALCLFQLVSIMLDAHFDYIRHGISRSAKYVLIVIIFLAVFSVWPLANKIERRLKTKMPRTAPYLAVLVIMIPGFIIGVLAGIGLVKIMYG